MAQNKVPYQRGLPMLEFFDLYRSQDRCEGAIRGWRWPEGFACPRCQGTSHSEFRRQGLLAMHPDRSCSCLRASAPWVDGGLSYLPLCSLNY